MKTNLQIVENIANNLQNEDFTAVADDIQLISHPRGYLYKIMACLVSDGDNWYPDSQESESWLKAIAPLLAGEYVVGNI